MIQSMQDLQNLIDEYGFFPFFRNSVPGFSVEEQTPSSLWFVKDVDGPWEWKGPLVRGKTCAYGKLFRRKAGFVSIKWLPDLLNYRRDGYDFDARYEDELASFKDKTLYDTVAASGEVLSNRLKQLCNYRKGGNTGFETVVTRLQMQTYLNISDFVYKKDRFGRDYGWAIAKYSTPERQFGADFVADAYRRDPRESEERIVSHLLRLFPNEKEQTLQELIRSAT